MNFLKRIGIEISDDGIEKPQKVQKKKKEKIKKREKIKSELVEEEDFRDIFTVETLNTDLGDIGTEQIKKVIKPSKKVFSKNKRVSATVKNDVIKYRSHKKRRILKRITSLFLSVFILFGAFSGITALKRYNLQNINLQEFFVKDFVVKYLENSQSEYVKSYSVDTKNITTSTLKNVVNINVISREEKQKEISYILKLTFIDNKDYYMKMTIISKNNTFIVVQNPILIGIDNVVSKPLSVDLEKFNDNLSQTSNIADVNLMNEITQSLTMFFKNYNTDQASLRNTSKFEIPFFGQGNFDVTTLKVNICRLEDEIITCNIQIDFSSDFLITKYSINIKMDTTNRIKQIELDKRKGVE